MLLLPELLLGLDLQIIFLQSHVPSTLVPVKQHMALKFFLLTYKACTGPDSLYLPDLLTL